jgi:23S rRNA (cytosine1962-C5)-methyltransferase
VSDPSIRIQRRAAERLLAGHVWVYASDVLDTGGASPGSAVAVLDPRGHHLGTGLYSSSSQIAVRLIGREALTFDASLIRERIQRAAAYRSRIVENTTAYRLVYSEADQLPGLIADRYGDFLVVQLLTQAMDAAAADVLAALQDVCTPKGIVLRNDAPVRVKERLPLTVTVEGDVPDQVELEMNGLRWIADLRHGQKTGLFLDQRENYLAAARVAHGRALDCFTSTGGFAIHLARQCEHVEAIDASDPALERASANARLNGVANVAFRNANVFDALAAHASQRTRFDAIVLDPPAFAKSKATVDKALTGYKEINIKALRLLGAGGVLVTCSCSHHVSEADFLEMLAAASLDAGRTLRIRERRVQAADHPVLLTVPETLYLKCVIAEVV